MRQTLHITGALMVVFGSIFLSTLSCYAEELQVVGIHKYDADPTEDAVLDINGDPCAKLFFSIDMEGVVFDGNIMGVRPVENGYYVYALDGTRRISVSHEMTLPVTINFDNTTAGPVRASNTYRVDLKVKNDNHDYPNSEKINFANRQFKNYCKTLNLIRSAGEYENNDNFRQANMLYASAAKLGSKEAFQTLVYKNENELAMIKDYLGDELYDGIISTQKIDNAGGDYLSEYPEKYSKKLMDAGALLQYLDFVYDNNIENFNEEELQAYNLKNTKTYYVEYNESNIEIFNQMFDCLLAIDELGQGGEGTFDYSDMWLYPVSLDGGKKDEEATENEPILKKRMQGEVKDGIIKIDLFTAPANSLNEFIEWYNVFLWINLQKICYLCEKASIQ